MPLLTLNVAIQVYCGYRSEEALEEVTQCSRQGQILKLTSTINYLVTNVAHFEDPPSILETITTDRSCSASNHPPVIRSKPLAAHFQASRSLAVR